MRVTTVIVPNGCAWESAGPGSLSGVDHTAGTANADKQNLDALKHLKVIRQKFRLQENVVNNDIQSLLSEAPDVSAHAFQHLLAIITKPHSGVRLLHIGDWHHIQSLGTFGVGRGIQATETGWQAIPVLIQRHMQPGFSQHLLQCMSERGLAGRRSPVEKNDLACLQGCGCSRHDAILTQFNWQNQMRRDLRPYWIKQVMDGLNEAWCQWFVVPQFDGCGPGCRFMYPGSVQISGPRISLGRDVHIMALPDKPVRLSVFEGLGSIHVGDYTIINPGSRVTSASSISIGKSCMLAMNAYLSDADWHDLHHRIYAPGATAPIVLEDNVWIGDSALVTKGVTIGENSVVGAWSVVTRDVPANVVVAGNPARIVRELDTSHLTTREHLFTGTQPYDEFEREYFTQLLGGNRFLNWLRSLLKPGRFD